jgi:hypothetical protein
MTVFHRLRTLDEVDRNLGNWVMYNPLFKSAIPQFDDSFDRGVLINLDYYVERKTLTGDSFERTLLNNLFSAHRNPTGKVYNLIGAVGSGKTSLCKYIAERLIPKEQHNTLVIYLDIWPSEDPNLIQHPELDKIFSEACNKSLKTSKKVANLKEFYESVLGYLGFLDLEPDKLMIMGDNLDTRKILEFLLNEPQHAKILIIIDNIDETSRDTVMTCRKFAIDLAKHVRQSRKKHISILIPMREYTAARFFDQEHFAHLDMPKLEEALVMKSKLLQASKSIKNNFQEYTQEIGYTKIYYPKKFIQQRRITITKDKAIGFLEQLSDILLSKDEKTFYTLIKELADGNFKIVVGNMYNFIHSCKLPLTKLFEKNFIPKEYQTAKDYADFVSINLGLECLMNIHYPFYDVNNSHVINLFNVNNERSPNDYKNTLCIPRLLLYLNNNGPKRKKSLYQRFEEFGYREYYLKRALDKCFTYGLTKSDHGRRTRDLVNDSVIRASNVATLYINSLIFETTYLQYVCEDTPMDRRFVVPIQKKYQPAGEDENRANRIRSVNLFLDFLKSEENHERLYIQNEINYDWNDFLFEFSYRQDFSGRDLSDYISVQWKKTSPMTP